MDNWSTIEHPCHGNDHRCNARTVSTSDDYLIFYFAASSSIVSFSLFFKHKQSRSSHLRWFEFNLPVFLCRLNIEGDCCIPLYLCEACLIFSLLFRTKICKCYHDNLRKLARYSNRVTPRNRIEKRKKSYGAAYRKPAKAVKSRTSRLWKHTKLQILEPNRTGL